MDVQRKIIEEKVKLKKALSDQIFNDLSGEKHRFLDLYSKAGEGGTPDTTQESYGVDKGIPQLITAGSSLDDIVMIVFFNSFMTIEKGSSLSVMTFLNIPLSIASGVGILLGFLLVFLFEKAHMRDSLKLCLIIGIAALLVYLESYLDKLFSFSSLLAVISLGVVILAKREKTAKGIASKCEKLWTVAEIFLLVLVGVSIQVQYFSKYLLMSLALLACSLLGRSIAVQACLIKTKLNFKERTFVAISYLPKATVQAAIGGSLLDYGNQAGNEAIVSAGIIVLSVSVVSILFTAPLAAFTMDLTYKNLTARTLYPEEKK